MKGRLAAYGRLWIRRILPKVTLGSTMKFEFPFLLSFKEETLFQKPVQNFLQSAQKKLAALDPAVREEEKQRLINKAKRQFPADYPAVESRILSFPSAVMTAEASVAPG
jgi:hypothetical protein